MLPFGLFINRLILKFILKEQQLIEKELTGKQKAVYL